MKIAVNVAREASGGPNILADVLRGWFGPDAGRPGNRHQVRLTPGPPWRLKPVRGTSDEGTGPVARDEAGDAADGVSPRAVDGANG